MQTKNTKKPRLPQFPPEPKSFAPNKYMRSDRELAEMNAKGASSLTALIKKLPEHGFNL